jgi:hypothetical protein
MEHQTKLQWIASASQGIFTAETPFGAVHLQEGTQKTNWQASLQMPWQVAATPAGNSVSAAMQRAQQAMLEYEARCKNHPLHWTKLAHKAPGLQNLEVRADTPFGFVDISCERNHLTEADEYTIDFWGNTLEHPDLQDLKSAQAAASNIYVELIRKEAAKLGLTEPTPAAD